MTIKRYVLAIAVAAAWAVGRADAQSMTGVSFGTVPPRAPATSARGAPSLQTPPALHSAEAVGPAAIRGLAPNTNRLATELNPYTAGYFSPNPYTAGVRTINQYNAGSFSPNPYIAGTSRTAVVWPVPGFQPTADQLRAATQFRVGGSSQFGTPGPLQFGAANQFGTVNQPDLVNQFGAADQFGQLGGINQLRTVNGVRGVGFPGFGFGTRRTATPADGRR
jgi:hypothetical protein